MSTLAFGTDDPNYFNQTVGVSSVTSITSEGSCQWKWGTSRTGSDGGQLTIEYNTCKIFGCKITSFPQNGGAGGTANLDSNDIIIVWDEDSGHGENEGSKNFTFTGTCHQIEESEYSDYLALSTTNSQTNWGVYLVTAGGTFTKGSAGTNEHEVLQLSHNIMEFTKQDNLAGQCVQPDDEITYTICWDNAFGDLVDNAYIVDYLPDGVSYPQGAWSIDPNEPNLVLLPPDPGYDPNTHSYTWSIGAIDPNTAGCVQLTVVVNEHAVPGTFLRNVAKMYLNDMLVATAIKDTDVCCWGIEPDLIYVDQSATGMNTGMSWQDAYTDLADAIERADNSLCVGAFTIYVAQSTYDPNNTPDKTFALKDGMAIYGGFPPGGSDFAYRNPKKYETTLTGLIDEDQIPDADTVVTMANNTLLDGVTVTGAKYYGLYGDGVDFTVEKCTFEKNNQYGIYTSNSNVDIRWCKVEHSRWDGIYHEGAGFDLTVENSWILRNGEYGVQCVGSTPQIKNSIISENDLSETGRAGLRMAYPTYPPTLYNNTISNNKSEGIYFKDNGNVSGDPNYLDYPDIQNCIVYYNNDNSSQLAGINSDVSAFYCCIQDCNEVNYNFNDKPMFAYTIDPNGVPDPNNYHLASNSFCIEAGNPLFANVGFDYDGEDRLMGNYVDVGADEVNPGCSDITNDLDWNADGIVNYEEFAVFAKAWQSYDPNHPLCDPNHPNFISDPNAPGYISEEDKLRYNPGCDLDEDLHVGISDLNLFANEWLWIACWKQQQLYAAMPQVESLSMIPFGTSSLRMTDSLSTSISSTSLVEVEQASDVSSETLIQILGFLTEISDHELVYINQIEELKAVLLDELKTVLKTDNATKFNKKKRQLYN